MEVLIRTKADGEEPCTHSGPQAWSPSEAHHLGNARCLLKGKASYWAFYCLPLKMAHKTWARWVRKVLDFTFGIPTVTHLGMRQGDSQLCVGLSARALSSAVLVHAFNPSTREAEAGGSLSVRDQPGLQS